MATILDVRAPWKWRPAKFRSAAFHVEAQSKESGRRVVTHEFPKKEFPYAEDMGRRAIEFTVRGYILTFVRDGTGELRRRNYQIARDLLITELEKKGPGVLQVNTLDPLMVVCTRYRLTEEEKTGGYCVFDMGFVEFGVKPSQPVEVDARARWSAVAEQRPTRAVEVDGGMIGEDRRARGGADHGERLARAAGRCPDARPSRVRLAQRLRRSDRQCAGADPER